MLILTSVLGFNQTVAAPHHVPTDEQILFFDDFEDGTLDKWMHYDRNATRVVQEEDGNYALELAGRDWTSVTVLGSDTWRDYAVEARVKIIKSTDEPVPDVVFNLRNTNRGNYTAYASSYGTAGIGATIDDDWRNFPTERAVDSTARLSPYIWHVIRFQVFGNQLSVYLDNQLVASFTEDEFQLGAGPISLGASPNAIVYLDDVYVLNTDVTTGLQPEDAVFEFYPISSDCDYDALPPASSEVLTGIMMRELNIRSQPNSSASIVGFIPQGTAINFTNEAMMGSTETLQLQLPHIEGGVQRQITSSLWHGVQVEDTSGYVWGRAVQANAPQEDFVNPYDVCFEQEDTTGWAEAIQEEIGETWLSFQEIYVIGQNIASTVGVNLVLDGNWIDQPIPLYGNDGELLAIALVSMRGYYIDSGGNLQSVILPIYVQIDVDYALLLDANAYQPGHYSSMIRPTFVANVFEEEYPDLRGRIICPMVSQDIDRTLATFFTSDGGQDIARQIALYQDAHFESLSRFIFAGDPGIGVLWSIDGDLEPCITRDNTQIELPVNETTARAAATVQQEVQQPEMVVIPGTIQSVLGCDEDWDPACEATALTFDEDNQIWRGVFELPAGSYEYKVAIDGSWTENYGGQADQDGPNVQLVLAQDTTVTFLYDHSTNWVADSVNHIIANVPGDFQNEIGCSESFGVEGDWAPDCLRTWLQDPDGDGIYIYTTSTIPAGDYEAKVAYDEAWDVNYGANGVSHGDNIPFSVPADDMVVVFTYDPASHELSIDVDEP
ncbi:MAG: hypothetical protein ACOCX5_05685 [Chloroflexota bacterium]